MEQHITLEADAWRTVLAEAAAPVDGSVVVRGPAAAQVGAAWHLLGYGPDGIVTDEAPVTAGDEGVSGAALVALLHAWSTPADLEVAARTAARWLRPRGVLLLAELHIDRLLGASVHSYPSALLYRMFPTTGSYVEARCASATDLVAAAIRTSLDDKVVLEFDRPLAVDDNRSQRPATAPLVSWRGIEQLDPEEQASLRAALAQVTPPTDPFVETEPWYAVAGRTRP